MVISSEAIQSFPASAFRKTPHINERHIMALLCCGTKAHGFRRTLRSGARSVAVGAAERPPFPVFQRATEPAEVVVLGWQRTVGLRQAFREGPFPVAASGSRRKQSGAQPGGVGAAVGG